MFETISFLVAMIGSSLAGIYDLKITPTEIPDIIPYAMIGLALILALVQSVFELNYMIFVNSLIYGISLLAFGYVMYRFGQWGGGDAKVLAAIGFLSPGLSTFMRNVQFPFAFSYLMNMFIVGAAYMLIYAFVLAALNKKIFSEFFRSVKSSSNIILISSSVLFFVFLFGNWYLFSSFNIAVSFQSVLVNSFALILLSTSLFLVFKFVKAVEDIAFKKKIPISKLRIGDVLMESKVWDGITEKELRKIKRSGKRSIWIKTGVCFAPTFPLALIFTLYFGDALLLFLKFLV